MSCCRRYQCNCFKMKIISLLRKIDSIIFIMDTNVTVSSTSSNSPIHSIEKRSVLLKVFLRTLLLANT